MAYLRNPSAYTAAAEADEMMSCSMICASACLLHQKYIVSAAAAAMLWSWGILLFRSTGEKLNCHVQVRKSISSSTGHSLALYEFSALSQRAVLIQFLKVARDPLPLLQRGKQRNLFRGYLHSEGAAALETDLCSRPRARVHIPLLHSPAEICIRKRQQWPRAARDNIIAVPN